jgi:brefeldin A-inhibited guanine nucleotide-exchange protein
MTSKNMVNQSTAKATLTQMLHVVFQRMESNTSMTEETKSPFTMADDPLDTLIHKIVTSLVDDVVMHNVGGLEGPVIHGNFGVVDEENEVGEKAGDYGWCIWSRKPANMLSESHDPVASAECAAEFRNLCDEGHAASIGFAVPGIENDSSRSYLNDAIIIFRSICKLSLKELSNPMTVYTMKSKILSLELILAVVDNPGPIFSSRKEFVDIIRSNLCESLIKNSISQDKTIFALSLSIFLALANNFKDHLKYEIGVFLEQIFLKILDSEHSSYHHKVLVL